MIDEIDRRLTEWIGSVLGSADVSLNAPSDGVTGRGIGLYLLELIRTQTPRGARRPPLQLSLRYVVTAWAESPEVAHRMLGDLLFAAMESSDFEVEADAVPIDLWKAFRVAPRPSFVLRAPLRRERPERPAPKVRAPLVIRYSPMGSLHGQVFGPGDIPVVDARLELPALQLSTRTDHNGRFGFPALPTDPAPTLLIVKAKGQELSVTTDQAVGTGEPLVIRLQGLEV